MIEDSVMLIHGLAGDHDDYDELSRSLHRRLSNFHLDPTIEVIRDIIRSYRELLGRPSSSDARITTLTKLAASLFTLGDSFDDEPALTEAMSLERDVLAMRLEGHPEHWFHCICAATTMNLHSVRTENMSLLEQAIALNRKAINTCVHGPSHQNDIAMAYAALAQSLQDYETHTGDLKSLEEAVLLRRQVLALRPTNHPLHAQACDDLALSLESTHIHSTAEVPAALEEAVALRRMILASSAPDSEDLGNMCDKLGITLRILYSVTKDPSTLRERLDVSARAISVCKNDLMLHTEMLIVRASLLCQHDPSGDHESDILAAVQSSRELRTSAMKTLPRRVLYNHVVWAFCDLLDFSTHPDVLEEATMTARKAYKGFSSHHRHRVQAGSMLGFILSKVHREVHSDALTIEARVLEREALEFTGLGHVDRVQRCINLGNTLCERFGRTGDRGLLDEVVDLAQETFDIICKLPENISRDLTAIVNLTYVRLLRHTEDRETTVKNLHYCIELQRMAYSKCPPGHSEEDRICGNLASGLHKLYEFEPSVPLREEIIELSRKAASITTEYANKAVWTCNVGVLLYDRYLHLPDESLLKEAIHAHQEADELSPSQWRPSNMLCKLYLLRNSSFFDIGHAIEYLHKSVSSNFDNPVEFLTQTAAQLDSIISHDISTLSQQGLLLEIYRKFMDFLPLLTNIALESSDMLHALRPVRSIGADALVLAVKMGLPQRGLQILEQARGNLWQQELHLRDPQLEDLPETQARELKQLFARIQRQRTAHGAPLSSAMRDERHDCGAQIDTLLKEIRTTSGFDRFMLEPEYETLTKAASNHPVVVLANSKLGCYAIMLRKASEAPLCIALDVRDEDLKTWVELTSIGQNRGAESPSVEAKTERGMRISLSSRANGVEVKLATLWHRVVKPVLQALKIQRGERNSRPRLHWCPTGRFSFIPVHAAGLYQNPHLETCSDYVVSSYTPTLASLSRATLKAKTLPLKDAAILLVAEENAYKAAYLPRLPYVPSESHRIASCARQGTGVSNVTIMSGNTIASEVSHGMTNNNVVHLACHGVQDGSNALSSGFCLSDQRLSISDIMELNIENGFLAFLSACETAKGDHKQPDQTVHLVSAMLFAGFSNVIATMWAMRDSDGPVVAHAFYEHLFSHEILDSDAVAFALDHAVTTLREQGAGPERWATFIHIGA